MKLEMTGWAAMVGGIVMGIITIRPIVALDIDFGGIMGNWSSAPSTGSGLSLFVGMPVDLLMAAFVFSCIVAAAGVDLLIAAGDERTKLENQLTTEGGAQ